MVFVCVFIDTLFCKMHGSVVYSKWPRAREREGRKEREGERVGRGSRDWQLQ